MDSSVLLISWAVTCLWFGMLVRHTMPHGELGRIAVVIVVLSSTFLVMDTTHRLSPQLLHSKSEPQSLSSGSGTDTERSRITNCPPGTKSCLKLSTYPISLKSPHSLQITSKCGLINKTSGRQSSKTLYGCRIKVRL